MAIFLGIVGLGLAIFGLITLLSEWDCTKVFEKAFLIFVFFLGIFVFLIPFYKNTKSLDKHVVILTNTYKNVQFDKVMKVEYDIYKGDNWWTWYNVISFSAENIKVSSE
jgi:hypothetical protein